MTARNNVTKLFKQELREMDSFFRRNYREIVVISLATLFLTLAGYHTIGPPWVSSLIYFAVLPIITIAVILRRNPLDFGLRLGNFKVWDKASRPLIPWRQSYPSGDG